MMAAKTEHAGAKNGGGYWGKRAEAKNRCKRLRRKEDRKSVSGEQSRMVRRRTNPLVNLVMLDADLAALYGVPTKRLNEAVRRNAARFPEDFMFQLTAEEAETLRSQFATSKGRGGRRYIPYAFTELGVAMLSSVLNSEQAVQVNIAIMRAFARLRELAASHKDVLRRLDEMEGKVDRQFKVVFDAIRALMEPPTKPRRRIGY